jgi:hypothetical protein
MKNPERKKEKNINWKLSRKILYKSHIILTFILTIISLLPLSTIEVFGQQKKGEKAGEKKAESFKIEPPKITSFIPESTARETIKIEGKTCKNCKVIIELNDSKTEIKVEKDGKFEHIIKLEKNKQNFIRIYSYSEGVSSEFIEYRIVQKELPLPKDFNEAPKIDKGSIPSFTREPGITVFGRALPLTKIVAKGGSSPTSTISDKDGYFEILVFLNFDTLNEIEIYAEDEKGFLSQKEKIEIYQITKAPPAPRLENPPEATNVEKIKLKGKAIPEMKVLAELSTGAKIETSTDRKGEFVIDVPLIQNSENVVSLFTVDQAGNLSAPTRVKIVQDSIPPAPPKIEKFPSRVIQDKATVIGKGEPETNIIAKSGTAEKVVGVVSKVGDFVVEVDVLKYERQVRKNFIQIFLEDKAGNRSEPSLIVIERLPDIRRLVFDLGGSFHTFHNFVGNQFFSELNQSPYKFVGFGAEIDGFYILQKGSGLAIGGVFGTYIIPPQKVKFRIEEDLPVEGKIDELSLSKTFIAFSPKVVLFAENFDLLFGVDFGTVILTKGAPETVVEGEYKKVKKVTRLYTGFLVRLSGKIKYFLNPSVAIFFSPAVGSAPIKNINEKGHTLDAGGISLTSGISLNF